MKTLKKVLYNVSRVLGSVLVMKKIVFLWISLFCFLKVPIQEVQALSIPVLAAENTVQVEREETMNIFENFYYRLFEKDTQDFFDYIILGIFVVGLLIVMVLQNTHYYMVMVPYESQELLDDNVHKGKKEPIVVIEPEEEKIEKKNLGKIIVLHI